MLRQHLEAIEAPHRRHTSRDRAGR
jgi:hypothetical protein